MACNFQIPFSGSPEDVLSRAKTSVENQGGIFNGNNEQGNFQVNAMGSTIRGSYTVNGQNLNISITDKPFLLPCGAIEAYLKSHLNG